MKKQLNTVSQAPAPYIPFPEAEKKLRRVTAFEGLLSLSQGTESVSAPIPLRNEDSVPSNPVVTESDHLRGKLSWGHLLALTIVFYCRGSSRTQAAFATTRDESAQIRGRQCETHRLS